MNINGIGMWLRSQLPKYWKKSRRSKHGYCYKTDAGLTVEIRADRSIFGKEGEVVFSIEGSVATNFTTDSDSEVLLFSVGVRNEMVAPDGEDADLYFHFGEDNLEIAQEMLNKVVLPWVEKFNDVETLLNFTKSICYEDISLAYDNFNYIISGLKEKYSSGAMKRSGLEVMAVIYANIGLKNKTIDSLKELREFIYPNFPEQILRLDAKIAELQEDVTNN